MRQHLRAAKRPTHLQPLALAAAMLMAAQAQAPVPGAVVHAERGQQHQRQSVGPALRRRSGQPELRYRHGLHRQWRAGQLCRRRWRAPCCRPGALRRGTNGGRGGQFTATVTLVSRPFRRARAIRLQRGRRADARFLGNGAARSNARPGRRQEHGTLRGFIVGAAVFTKRRMRLQLRHAGRYDECLCERLAGGKLRRERARSATSRGGRAPKRASARWCVDGVGSQWDVKYNSIRRTVRWNHDRTTGRRGRQGDRHQRRQAAHRWHRRATVGGKLTSSPRQPAAAAR